MVGRGCWVAALGGTHLADQIGELLQRDPWEATVGAEGRMRGCDHRSNPSPLTLWVLTAGNSNSASISEKAHVHYGQLGENISGGHLAEEANDGITYNVGECKGGSQLLWSPIQGVQKWEAKLLCKVDSPGGVGRRGSQATGALWAWAARMAYSPRSVRRGVRAGPLGKHR